MFWSYFIGNFILAFVVGSAGSKREIGFWASFIVSAAFSSLIGLLFVSTSKRLEDVESELTPTEELEVDKKFQSEFIDLKRKLSIDGNLPNENFRMSVIYAQSRNASKSFYYLEKAINSGFSNIDFIKTTPQLRFIQEHSDFEMFISSFLKQPTVTISSTDRYADLEKISNLRDKGVLNEEEFQIEKAKILNNQ